MGRQPRAMGCAVSASMYPVTMAPYPMLAGGTVLMQLPGAPVLLGCKNLRGSSWNGHNGHLSAINVFCGVLARLFCNVYAMLYIRLYLRKICQMLLSLCARGSEHMSFVSFR